MNAKWNVFFALLLLGIPANLKADPPEFSTSSQSAGEIRGFKGTGPFKPLIHEYYLQNETDQFIEWTADTEITGMPALDGCLDVLPRSGTFHPNSGQNIRVALTGKALDLPAGTHAAMLSIHSPNTSVQLPISIQVVNPTQLVENGGFENGWNGWAATGNATIESAPTYVPEEGIKIVAFNSNNSTPGGIISQTIPTEAGVTYAIDFQLGTLSYNTSQQRLHLTATNVSETPSPALLDVTTTIQGVCGGATSWSGRHYEFIATGPRTLLTFQDVSTATSSIDMLMDHVEVQNPGFGIVVTTSSDENDPAPGMGSGMSLREALAEANLRPGTNRIEFDPSLNGAEIQLSHGRLVVAGDVAIDASHLPAGISISSTQSRLIESTAACSLNHLTWMNGDDSLESEPGGGAILNKHEMMVVDSAILQNHSIEMGGGIYNTGNLEVHRCVIENNQSDGIGGGVSTRYGNTHIGYSQLSNNSAATYGGALTSLGALGSSWVMLSHTALWNNSSSLRGGAYSGIGGYKQTGVLHALNSTFAHNSAVESGGAMEGPGIIDLAHCTLSGNQSTGPSGTGGGIHSAGLNLRQSIIADNSAITDPNLSNCIIANSVSNFVDGNPKLLNKGNGILIPDIGSPVIDTGFSASNIPATDQRGKPRVSGAALDIGAVEFQVRTVDTLADEDNGLAVGGISLRDAVNAQSTDPVELIDFAPNLDGGTIVLNQMIGNYLRDIAIDASDLPSGIRVSGDDQSGIFQFLWCSAFVRNLTLEDCNSSAITIGDASLEMEDCVFRDNHSSTSGGALKTIGSLSTFAILTKCHFDANSSDGAGGAISNEGIIHVINSSFIDNHAQLKGGAISSGAYRSGLRLINSTLAGNSSELNGGAIAAASAQLIHSTLTGNSAPNGSGGGIHSESTFENPELGFTYANCIIAGNNAASAPDVSGLINATYGGNLVGTDPHLAPLADYGSGIPVMPPLAGSPAIEGGQLLDETPALDALGHPRPSGPLPDLGAVEAFAWSQLTLLDTDNDGIDDRLEPAYQMTVGVDDIARDLDGDGCTDAVELSNMTDPTDPQSKFGILAIVPAAGFDSATNPVFDLTFSSFPGLGYTAECHSGLDFGGPGTRNTPLGTADDFQCTRRVTLENNRDFVRVKRDP